MINYVVTTRNKAGALEERAYTAENRADLFKQLAADGITAVRIAEGVPGKKPRKASSSGGAKLPLKTVGLVAASLVALIAAVVIIMSLTGESGDSEVGLKKNHVDVATKSQEDGRISEDSLAAKQRVVVKTGLDSDSEKAGTEAQPTARRQLTGAALIIAEAEAKGIRPMFKHESENFLAMYVEPGKPVPPPPISKQLVQDMKNALVDRIMISETDDERTVQIKEMVVGMKEELRQFLKDGGTVEAYFKELDRRQEQESQMYAESTKAVIEMVNSADGDYTEAYEYYKRVNNMLGERGIRQMPLPLKLIKAGFESK